MKVEMAIQVSQQGLYTYFREITEPSRHFHQGADV
jgi:hypothetical protein